MKKEVVMRLMFEYDDMYQGEIYELARSMPKKILRWLGITHPDNNTRKIFYKLTNVEIGDDTVINRDFIINDNYKPLVKIGCRVSIAPRVTVIAVSEPNNSNLRECSKYVSENLIKCEQVVIEDDAWIGTNVSILPGVTIGEKSVVGAGTVVDKDVPRKTIVAGIPAKVIRRLE